MKKLISVILALATLSTFAVFAQARLLGDVNSDGNVTSTDALEVLSYSVGLIDTINQTRADVNGDKNINSTDALIILQIAVGSYTGELTVNDEPQATLKSTVVDPVMNSRKFTLRFTVTSEGKTIPTTVMFNGDNMSIDVSYGSMGCRFLLLDGKNYLIFPTLKVYSQINEFPEIPFGTSATGKLIKSEDKVIGDKTYICETYKYLDETVKKYYFLDGEWKMVETVTKDGEVTIQVIDYFAAGYDEANFKLSGYYKVSDLSKYIK